MKFKGTNDEWICHFADDTVECNCKYVLAANSEVSIATINCKSDDENEGPSDEKAKYNALLIIKAPEMFRMLKTCLVKEIDRTDSDYELINELSIFLKSCTEIPK